MKTKLVNLSLILGVSILFVGCGNDNGTSAIVAEQQQTILSSLAKSQSEVAVESNSGDSVSFTSSSTYLGKKIIDGQEVQVTQESTTINSPIGEVELNADKAFDDEGNLVAIEFN